VRNILVTGGAGYVGTVLTGRLLAAGYNVAVYDAMYYGCRLTPQPRLRMIEGDIRDEAKFRDACWGADAVIHLACISNDPSFELDVNVRSPGRDLERLPLHLVEIVGKHLERDRPIRNDLQNLQRKGLIVNDPSLAHECRIGREALDPGLCGQTLYGFKVGAVGENLDLEGGEPAHQNPLTEGS